MAQGKFSQPRQSRPEEDDLEAVLRRRRESQGADIPQQTEPQRDASLDETQFLSETMMIKNLPTQEDPSSLEETQYLKVPATEVAVPDVPSFEETQFLQETSEAPSVQPVSYSEETYEEDYEEEYEEAPRRRSRGRTQKALIVSIIIVTILLLISIGVGIMLFLQANADDGLILSNVSVAGINLGGMTPDEAEKAIHRATDLTYSNEDMVVQLPDSTLLLSPADTGVKLDVAAVVEAAYNYGRTGTKEENAKAKENANFTTHTIALLPYLNLNTDYIRQALDEYGESFNTSYVPANYVVEGQMPELAADLFDQNAPCQTLVLNPGVPGKNLDLDKVYNQILDAYSLHVFFLAAGVHVDSVSEPDPIDLEAIYEEFYIEPVNASMDLQNFQTIAGSYGYGFNLEEARKLEDNAQPGEVLRIPMEYIPPEVLDNNAFFSDTLGQYQTRGTNHDDRNRNLQLACEALDGTVLNPGESLSFSSILRQASGFREAPEDTGLEEIEAGGTSQVASTLYYAALLSDLNISSRSNHSYLPSFIDYGLDATTNLKLVNSTGYPIQISAQYSGGYVKVEILGTEERDYYVMLESSISSSTAAKTVYEDYPYDNDEGYEDGDVIEEGSAGYLVKSYKVKYNRSTGRELSRDFLANSQYPAVDRIVARVEDPPETEPETEPPTQAPTEPPTRPTVPPTEAPTLPPTEATLPPPETQPATQPAENPITQTQPEILSDPEIPDDLEFEE